jgi:hypothetical protein
MSQVEKPIPQFGRLFSLTPLFPFDVIFPLLSKSKVNYLALDLNQKPNLEDCQNNLMKSIEFLKKNY